MTSRPQSARIFLIPARPSYVYWRHFPNVLSSPIVQIFTSAMLSISPEQMLSLSRNFEQRQEAPWIEREFRASYGEALAGLDDEFLRGEIRDCLKRCDELALSRKVDRLLLSALCRKNTQ